MLRKILEAKFGPMTDSEFRKVLGYVTIDILINNVGFDRKTTLCDVVKIAEIVLGLLRLCQVA